MVLIRAAAEKASGVPIDPGDVQSEVLLREGTPHLSKGIFGQRVKRLVEHTHILLPVFLKPGALIMEREIPEKLRGLASESFKHGF
jgi:hypothetical protein